MIWIERGYRMLKQWYIQLLILILIWIILTFITKRFISKKYPKFKRLDVFSIFLLIAIHFLSQNLIGLSLIPFLVCGLSLYGLAMTILYAVLEGQIIYKKFLSRFWRVVDLVILGLYCVLLIFKIVSLF